jgi:asparagine synthase (glutamine-hydrolysing)
LGGIAGIVHFDGTAANQTDVEQMLHAIAHRGPDGSGVHVSGPVGLGHRRLAQAGQQPLSNADGSIRVTCNGTIYNADTIRRHLQQSGHRFQTETDAEVIVHAYQASGTDCVQQFNGMFAYGVWDEPRQRLWLVRDCLGIKPLFYCHLPTCLLFGSEIKAILSHPQVPRALDYTALAYYLALNFMPAPYTLFQHIRQLPPGHSLLVDTQGHVQEHEYWDITYHESDYRTETEYVQAFHTHLQEAIQVRLPHDAPAGVFLSGGLDSSSIASMMAQTLQRPVQTFALGFDDTSFGDLPAAQHVAQAINADHHERTTTPDIADLLPRIIWHAEEPTADPSMLALYSLAQMARAHVDVVLNGAGADEILAGHDRYQAASPHWLAQLVPNQWYQRSVKPLLTALPGRTMSIEDALATWRMVFIAEARRELLSPIWKHQEAQADALDLYRATLTHTNATDPLNRLLYADTRFTLPNNTLVQIDRMTMAHGLEARQPFLDHRLVLLAASIPPALKLQKGQGKSILKAAMQDQLPNEILQRRKEATSPPLAHWIQTSLKSFVIDHLSPDRMRRMGLLNPHVVEHVLQRHFTGIDTSNQIWGLLTLSLWWQQFIEA